MRRYEVENLWTRESHVLAREAPEEASEAQGKDLMNGTFMKKHHSFVDIFTSLWHLIVSISYRLGSEH